MSEQSNVPMSLAQALAAKVIATRCELTTDDGMRRCPENAVAIRWEHGFFDSVCERHSVTAGERGAVVVRPDQERCS